MGMWLTVSGAVAVMTILIGCCGAGEMSINSSPAKLPIPASDRPDSRPRLLVLTDIGGDPDDQQSLVRLLVHANEFDIAGFIASAAGTPGELKEKHTRPDLIRQEIEAYGKVLPRLKVHAPGFPEAKRLLEAVKSGNPNRGRAFIGEGHDTEGSRWIITCVDKPGPRPLNLCIWGGQTDLAQALWRIRKDRSPAELKTFLSRLRIFDTNDQDKIHNWIISEFPSLFYILAQVADGGDRRQGGYRGIYLTGDESLTSRDWIDEHVRKDHGPLGELYPPKTWTAPNPHGAMKEGDTPSWFFFLPVGLGDSTHPEYGGWGGRYALKSGSLYRDAKEDLDGQTDARFGVSRWRPAFQNEFAARMDWCVAADYRSANHPPVAVLNGDTSSRPVTIAARPGQTVSLMAKGSTDPDGTTVDCRWFLDPVPGVLLAGVTLSTDHGESISLQIPSPAPTAEVHVVLEVKDRGQPPLVRYRRAIVRIAPSAP
jgi:hypothetical protein